MVGDATAAEKEPLCRKSKPDNRIARVRANMAEQMKSSNSPRLFKRFKIPIRADVHVGDALEFLRSLPSNSANVVFLDPPFNLGKKYGKLVGDSRSSETYTRWLKSIIDEGVRVLANGGALYLYHLPSWAVQLVAHLGTALTFRHWIAVSMKNGFVRGKRLYPAHYALLFYTKGLPTSFQRPKVPVEYCDCGRTKKDYGGYKQIVEELGLNLSDIWDDISPVRHRSTKRRAANELPRRLTDRIVAISGGPDLMFVDPFAGGGSALLSAARARMRIQACDLVEANARIQVEALANLRREMTKK